ncbi:MAG: phosphodiester glycosidase family protein [Muribaculaceae bacterium]|nr:phosphodiester glycosidase family protein [Muribaculaceae bacterium]
MRPKFLSHLIIAALAGSTFPAEAATSVNLQGVEFKVDTLRHVKTGPGTMFTSLLIQSQSTTKVMRTFVLTMDMKGHDNVEYRMEIGNDTTLTSERISSIAKRKTDSDTHYFAAVNSDFFITSSYVAKYAGEPHMDCIMDGEIASTGYLNAADYGHFFMDHDKNMWCDNPTQTFEITYPDGTTVALPRINEDIFENETVLFNSKYGKQTRVAGCTEVQVRLADGETWGVNRPIKLIVSSEPSTSGATPINKGEAVLSAIGTGAANIAALEPGDELTANFNITMQDYGISPDIKECSGGDVVILKKGEVIYEAHRFINSRDGNNPRTMLGYSEDRSKMVWCVVDGRSPISSGCTYPEGAELMKFLGCYDALNVDGGGSSGMYIDALGIVNKPSDGQERAVGNGIFAVLNAPEDNEIAEIKFLDHAGVFPKYGLYKPVFYGYNKYGLLIDTDVQGVTLYCPEELGEITNDGTTLFGNGSGTHALTATYNGMTASIPVTIETENSPELKYTDVLIDNFRKWEIEVQTMVKEQYMSVNPMALSWSSDNEQVALVDELGIVSGKQDGKAILTGTVGDFTGNINMTVECPTANVMPIEKGFDPATWTVSSKSSIKTYGLAAGENSLKVNTTLSSTRNPQITLAKTITAWSLPDKIRIRINPGNTTFSKITFKLNANGAQAKNIAYEEFTTDANGEYVFEIPTSDIGDINDIGIYPISFNSAMFVFKGSTGTDYSFDITAIEAIYDNIPSGIDGVNSDPQANASLRLSPCPANAGETVIATVNNDGTAQYSIHSVAGAAVSAGTANPDAGTIGIPTAGIVPGLYLVTVTQDGISTTARLLIK